MSFEDIHHQVNKIYGYMPPTDCEVLYKYASKVSGVIVEIGALCGKSSKMLCMSSPESQVHSFDNFSSPDIKKKIIFSNMERIKNWHFHEVDSVKGGMEWNKPIDLLIVDGDHHREMVEKDIIAWLPKVKSGSYVLFHDYYHYKQVDYVVPAVDKFDYLFSEAKNYIDDKGIESMFRICKKK